MAQNVADAVNNALDDRKTQKLPYFYNTKKDTYTARQLVDKIDEIATANPAWNDQKKIVELKQCLQDVAKTCFEAHLRTFGVEEEDQGKDIGTWAVFKNEFLQQFDPTGTAKQLSVPLLDMRQKTSEDVTCFFARVDSHFRRLEESHPQTNVNVTDARAAAIGADTAERRAELLKNNRLLVTEVYRRMEGLLFTAGISSDEIRHHIMNEKKSDRIAAAVRTAQDQERILEKKKVTAVKSLNALKDDDDEEEPADEELPSLNAVLAFEPEDEEDLAWCNAMRTKYRLPLKKKTFAPRNGNGNGAGAKTMDKKNMVCRYKPCGKKGHLQADCYLRKKHNAPCVDANGVPYRSQPKVNASANEPAAHLNEYRIM